MIEPCDHPRTKSTLSGFRTATKFVGFQDDGEGGTLILGRCLKCDTTLAVQIDLVRGHVVAGEVPMCRRPHSDEPPF